jgi:hypothetical protein
VFNLPDIVIGAVSAVGFIELTFIVYLFIKVSNVEENVSVLSIQLQEERTKNAALQTQLKLQGQKPEDVKSSIDALVTSINKG